MTRFLRWILKQLQRFGMAFGRFNNKLIMGLSFYLLLFPIGLVRRLLVGKKRDSSQGWRAKEPLPRDHFKKQY